MSQNRKLWIGSFGEIWSFGSFGFAFCGMGNLRGGIQAYFVKHDVALQRMKDRITKTKSDSSNKLSGKITREEKKLPFEKANEKKFFHIRSKHRDSYDFEALVKSHPALKKHVITNKYGTESVAFADPLAVKELNTALLLHFYDLQWWDIPKGYLCPPIPGRADYIHHVSDLFTQVSKLKISKLKCLDVGAGANCIYPIIGAREYGWNFIAADIDEQAIENMNLIISKNKGLADLIKPKLQKNPDQMISGVLAKNAKVDVVVCNPPFFESAQASSKATNRKLKNLGLGKDGKKPVHNFGGMPTELWTDGGEKSFIKKLIMESVEWKKKCFWFTSLVSRKESLNTLLKTLDSVEAADVKIIRMNQGNKSSRILAWTFLDEEAQQEWAKKRF